MLGGGGGPTPQRLHMLGSDPLPGSDVRQLKTRDLYTPQQDGETVAVPAVVWGVAM